MSTTSSPFTQAVVSAMRKLYPEKLADSSFDNTGLLLEAPHRENHLKDSVLLTVDLTKGVADEAIRRKDSVIVTYHPIIFRPLKAVTLANSQQSSLLRLAQEGISVYSPHTAVDAAPEGLNDWLADIVTNRPLRKNQSIGTESIEHERSIINSVKDIPNGFEGAGYGRIVRFKQPQKLGDLVARMQSSLQIGGRISGLSIAVPQSIPRGQKSSIEISSIGICAGSGGSMLNGLDVDLLFTGELSHHEALAAVEQGKCVVTAFHSNTERAFLKDRMQTALTEALEGKAEIAVSEVDRDPFDIIHKDEVDW
ncbi:hypothetical protein OCU04_007477 [Sclerotinia nivalis]|uniref:NGG1 interacting factor Nif3 n=1 Tax=Sclerotinia nivalis TaxID=352851 RepID=A0A9X0AJR5_9HELO|nr:hypothetical protein OCU04_007477 [Sclerotinia nivalis]